VKVTYTTSNGRIKFEAELEKVKTAFEFIAHVGELFEEKACGCCKSENIRPQVRHHESFVFYELRCQDCDAQLSFGQKKEGGNLFPKRYDTEARQAMPDRGWHHYEPVTTTNGRPQQQPPQQQQPQQQRREEIPF
jgi:hypothetical protein